MVSNHREDLRGTLLKAGRTLIEEVGHEAVSVRKLAIHAGVSSGAPYHHFPDKRSLLLALALDGFRRMNAMASDIATVHAANSRLALHRLAVGFLDFCAAHPRLVDLMYESELTRPVDPALLPMFREAFDTVAAVVRSAQPDVSDDVVNLRSVTFWSATFGLSRLLRHGLLEPFDLNITQEWQSYALQQITMAALQDPGE